MKFVSFNKIAISVLAAAFIIAALCFYKTAFATDTTFDYKSQIAKEYEINDILELPACTATYNGKTYETTVKLYYPDGRISENVKNSLDCVGTYSAVYSFTADKEITDTKTFVVRNGYKGLFSNSDGLTVEGYCNIPEEIASDSYSGCKTGVKLRITKDGAKTKFNGIVDLRDSARNIPFISFQVIPSELKKMDFSRFFITLTDVYDENNYVVIQVQAGESGAQYGLNYPYVTYFATQACGKYSPLGFVYGHDQYNINGQTSNHAFGGIAAGWPTGAGHICFDLSELALYVISGGESRRVLKYNDTEVLSAQQLWGGFTTGEVYVSFEFDRLNNPAAEIVISSIGGVNIDENYFAERKQTVVVNFGEFNSVGVVDGVKGGTYPVYDAVLYDNISGIILPDCIKVFYRNNELPIINGKFATERRGDYVIEYVFSTESFTKKHYVNVKVNNNYTQLIDYQINPEIPSKMSVGETLYIYDGEASGGVGSLVVTPRLYLDGEEKELRQGIKFFEYDIREIGEYTLKFTIKDALDGEITVEKEIVVAYNDAPVIIEPSLPEYVIDGQSVIFPTPKAICVTESGEQNIEVKTYIGETDYTDKAYTPNGDFTVKYVASYNGNETVLEKEIKVLTVGTGSDFTKSFFASSQIVTGVDDIEINYKTEDTENLYFATDQDKAYFIFGRKVYADGFKVVFGVDDDRNDFSRINIYLTDSVNATCSIKLSYVKEVRGTAETVLLYVNDIYCTAVDGSFGGSRIPFSFVIDNAKKNISDEEYNIISHIMATRYGTAFNGFTSGEIYIKFEFEGVMGQSAIKISELGNQLLSYKIEKDNAVPVIVFDKNMAYTNLAYYGEVFAVSDCVAYDVLNNVKSFKVKANSPSGRLLLEQDAGSAFDIELKEYGNYKILFTVEDESGKKLNFTRYISVIDGIKPEITVEEQYKTIYNVGESLVLPKFSVSDNSGEYVSVIYIIDCKGQSVNVSDGYKFIQSGTYKLLIYVRDGNYNFVMKQIDLTVIGGNG